MRAHKSLRLCAAFEALPRHPSRCATHRARAQARALPAGRGAAGVPCPRCQRAVLVPRPTQAVSAAVAAPVSSSPALAPRSSPPLLRAQRSSRTHACLLPPYSYEYEPLTVFPLGAKPFPLPRNYTVRQLRGPPVNHTPLTNADVCVCVWCAEPRVGSGGRVLGALSGGRAPVSPSHRRLPSRRRRAAVEPAAQDGTRQ